MKMHRYGNGGGEEDTNNMCREILVEPLSDNRPHRTSSI